MIDAKNANKNRQKEVFLESLKKGVSIVKACKAADVNVSTVWRWRQRSKDFENQILAILDSRTQTVEDALFVNAVKGNVVAQIFWLKNRSNGRWKDKTINELTGVDGSPLTFIIEKSYESKDDKDKVNP